MVCSSAAPQMNTEQQLCPASAVTPGQALPSDHRCEAAMKMTNEQSPLEPVAHTLLCTHCCITHCYIPGVSDEVSLTAPPVIALLDVVGMKAGCKSSDAFWFYRIGLDSF